MRRLIGNAVAAAATLAAPSLVLAADPPVARPSAAPRPAAPPVIGSHQIDRYDAIQKVQKTLEANPKSLADWVILGELTQEVAMDVPADKAGQYFDMSRDAFEKALALAPNNAGLKAAVQFAKDQQANVDQFEKSRDAVTDTFLEARRRDLAATGNTPYVKIYSTPPVPERTLPGPNPTPAAPPTVVTAPASNPIPATTAPQAQTDAVAQDTANYGVRQDFNAGNPAGTLIYPGPVYRPFASASGVPYTYQQYNSSYFPPGLYSNSAVAPVTIQRYAPVAPQVVPNTIERQILKRNPVVAPAPR